jgi:hypothetical protein
MPRHARTSLSLPLSLSHTHTPWRSEKRGKGADNKCNAGNMARGRAGSWGGVALRPNGRNLPELQQRVATGPSQGCHVSERPTGCQAKHRQCVAVAVGGDNQAKGHARCNTKAFPSTSRRSRIRVTGQGADGEYSPITGIIGSGLLTAGRVQHKTEKVVHTHTHFDGSLAAIFEVGNLEHERRGSIFREQVPRRAARGLGR